MVNTKTLVTNKNLSGKDAIEIMHEIQKDNYSNMDLLLKECERIMSTVSFIKNFQVHQLENTITTARLGSNN